MRLASRPVFLAGREPLLAELDAQLSSGDGDRPRTVALCGAAGSGKTSIAVEYAYRHLDRVGLAWQFAAEEPAVLAASFRELAARLGGQAVLDTRDPVAWVHKALAAFSPGWLLVFDDAPEMAAVEAFVPPAGRGRVVITSRNEQWRAGQVLEVPALDSDAAAGFLINRTADQNQRAACELADGRELGGLPLALEHAAACIQATRDSLAGYLASFRQRRAELLAAGEPAGYPGTVATTWTLAFDQLQQAHPHAVALLRLLAYCAPDSIPARLFLQLPPGLTGQFAPQVAPALVPLLQDQIAAMDALAVLRRYSLITTATDGSVSVHRLVQAVTSDQMTTELVSAWRQATADVIEAALPDDPEQPRNWPDYAALLPHALTALAPDSYGMALVASYLGKTGNYAGASQLEHRVLEARELVLGREHAETLHSRAKLASWTGQAGDAAGARDQFTALLPVIRRVLGPADPDTLAAGASLAYWTGQAGDAAAARDQLATQLPVAERILGPEHPDTLVDRHNLANFAGYAGDAAGARDQFAALLPVRERVSGPNHPDTLIARLNLAYWTGRAGDAARACAQFAALLPIAERFLGAEHADTLAARKELAYWTGQAGDAAAARDQFAALLPVAERVFGPEHPDTLANCHHLAMFAGYAGNAAGARDRCAALLPVAVRVFGPDHPQSLEIRKDLAYWTGRAGDAVRARDQCAALLPVRERILGPEHPDTLTTRASVAYWTAHAGDAAGARDQYWALLRVRERVLGSEHPDTLATRHQLAYWTAKAGDTAGARDQFAELLPVRERVLGPEHPDTQATRTSLVHLTEGAGLLLRKWLRRPD